MLSKRSIVLSDLDYKSNRRAVLTLEKEGEEVNGTIRFYNFPLAIEGILTLGFYVDNKVIKSGLTYKSTSFYTFKLVDNFINEKFSCAVLNFSDAEVMPILYGSSEGRDEDVYASIIESLSDDFSKDNVEKALDSHGIDYEEHEKREIENEIDRCMGDCKNCFYKEQFYANEIDNVEQKVKSVEENENLKKDMEEGEEKEDEETFFLRLKPQIDKLFEKNPAETNLEEMFPSSKWVKVEYEDDGDFYVFGLIYQDNEVKYVCYGVPAVYEKEPPKELSGYPIFIPLNKEDKEGFGYYITYQDAETGEPIKAVVE